jgi:hypothetical protein
MNMKRCEECGKELGLLEGYHHPTLGREFLLCTQCFEIVDDSVTKWREAVLPYIDYFENKSSKHSVQLGFKNVLTDFGQIKEMFGVRRI